MSGQGEIRYAVATGAACVQAKPKKTTQRKQAAPAVKAPTIGQKKSVQQAGFSFKLPSLKEIGAQSAKEQKLKAERQSNELEDMKRRFKAEPNWFKKAGIVIGYIITNSGNTDPLAYDGTYNGYNNY